LRTKAVSKYGQQREFIFIVVGITYGKERLAAQQDGVVGRCKYRSEMIKSGYDGQKAVQQSRVNGDGSIAKIHGG
jgi:hypothetical protein